MKYNKTVEKYDGTRLVRSALVHLMGGGLSDATSYMCTTDALSSDMRFCLGIRIEWKDAYPTITHFRCYYTQFVFVDKYAHYIAIGIHLPSHKIFFFVGR